jgi:hypothetical protein
LDIQSSKLGRKAYPHQNSSISNYDAYDVSVSNPQRTTTKDKSHPKIFPMARRRKQKEMDPGGLGQGMQTKNQRRPGVTRPTGNQRGLRGKALVEMGKRQIGAMGKHMEGQVCPEHQ